MKPKVKVSAVLGLLALLLAIPAMPATASAFDCDSLVADETGRLGDVGAIGAAASRLTSLGADVRVRLVQTMDNAPTLEHLVVSLTKQCPSWQSAGGGRKNNLVLAIVVLGKHKTGLYYGSLWRSALENETARIQSQEMNPRFRDGDIAGGLAAGLNETAAVIKAYQDRPRGPVGSGATGSHTTIINNEKPSDLTGLWWVLGGSLGLLAVCLLVWALWRRKRANDRRLAVQLEAQKAKGACTAEIMENTDRVRRLETTYNTVLDGVPTEELGALPGKLAEVKSQLSAATVQYGDLSQSAGDPDSPGLSLEQYQSLASAYGDVLAKLRGNRWSIEQVEADLDSFQRTVAEATKAYAQAESRLAAATEAVHAAGSEGFKTDSLQAKLDDVKRRLQTAKSDLDRRLYRSLAGQCSEIGQEADEVSHIAVGLPQLKAKIKADCRANREAYSVISAVAKGTAVTFNQMKADFPGCRANWQRYDRDAGQIGIVNEIENNLLDAIHLTEVAETQAACGGDLIQADNLCRQAKSRLEAAKSGTETVIALVTTLNQAKSYASEAVAAAIHAVDLATATLNEVDRSIADDLRPKLNEAARQSGEARIELESTADPDWPNLIERAEAAKRAAMEVQQEAEDRQQGLLHLRAQAESMIRDAERRITEAENLIASSGDVGPNAVASLNEARRYLAEAVAQADPNDALVMARQAHSQADSAYGQARDDIERARYERQRQVDYDRGYTRRGDGFGDAIAGGIIGGMIGSSLSDDHHHHHDDDSGSGSSSVFGSSSDDDDDDRRSGGSSGWGSSDSGGGSDSDWGGSDSGGGSDSDW